jgi:glucokinase
MKIGIDIGGSHIGTGIIVGKGVLLGKETKDIDIAKIESEERVKEVMLEIIDMEISTLLKRYDFKISDISRIGLAVPGSPTEDSIQNLVNLHIKKFEIGKILAEKYNTKIKIKNDGKCAGFAEKKYGALKDFNDCIFLCLGTGVGSAVFLNGELLEPKRHPGFEFGHMIIQKDGRECNCGNKGCWETYASMKRFKKEAIVRLGLPKDTESIEVQNYIRKNMDKPETKALVDELLTNVAIGLSNLINIFEPEAICFGGSFVYYNDIFLPILREKLKLYLFNKDFEGKIVAAKLKNDAGMIGAAEI